MLVARPLHRQYGTMSPAQEAISVVWGRRSHQNSGKHLHPGLLSMTDYISSLHWKNWIICIHGLVMFHEQDLLTENQH